MITVYTSITGDKDPIQEAQNVQGAKFIAYTDQPMESKVWTRREAYNRFLSPRRNSRAPKILAHQFIEGPYSIWIDGNLRLVMDAQKVIDTYLNGYDLAVFKHPVRDCLYDEAKACAVRKLDDPEAIIEQVSRYEREGFGKNKGLGECMMLVRRHSPKMERFNDIWWSEWCRGCVRDQVSFMYAVEKSGIRVNFIDEQFKEKDGAWDRGGIVQIVDHNNYNRE